MEISICDFHVAFWFERHNWMMKVKVKEEKIYQNINNLLVLLGD